MISFHKRVLNSTSGDRSDYKHGWFAADVLDADRISKCIMNHVWSPCIWREGIRLQYNFTGARLIALDFDDGVPLNDICKEFSNHWHVIATTKSHQKNKNGLVCDRFRLILQADAWVDNLGYYRSLMEGFINELGADKKCKDGARFFYPCTEIISVQNTGLDVSVIEALHRYRSRPVSIRAKQYTPPVDKAVDAWINYNLKSGIPKGERNTTVFRMVGTLLGRGFTKNEITAMIAGSEIPCRDFTMGEISEIVTNARPR